MLNTVRGWQQGIEAAAEYSRERNARWLENVRRLTARESTRMTRCESMTAEANDVKLVQDGVASVDERAREEY